MLVLPIRFKTPISFMYMTRIFIPTFSITRLTKDMDNKSVLRNSKNLLIKTIPISPYGIKLPHTFLFRIIVPTTKYE